MFFIIIKVMKIFNSKYVYFLQKPWKFVRMLLNIYFFMLRIVLLLLEAFQCFLMNVRPLLKRYKGYSKPLTVAHRKLIIFQSKLPITKQYHILLNSQLNVVLNSIICFTVRFCDNSLLVLKMYFQVLSFVSKTLHGFCSDIRILMPQKPLFFYLQD